MNSQFKTSLLLVALAFGAVEARAQQVVFHEDFEAGFGTWSTSGLWNLESATDPCGSTVAPFPAGNTAAYWGLDDTCLYDSPTLSGSLRMTIPVHLPASSATAILRFWSYDGVECDSCGWDWRFIYISNDGGATFDFLGESNRSFLWYERLFVLDDYLGDDILLLFSFDAVDGLANHSVGWLIDDILIELDCTVPTNYCTGFPNSAGPGATMGWSGSSSMAANDFHVTVSGAPPAHHGTFFYGLFPAEYAFGDGVRCIATGGGNFRLSPSMQTDAAGALSRRLDFTLPPANAGPGMIQPGNTWHFQFFYRDQVPGGTGFNLSDGLRMGFCP